MNTIKKILITTPILKNVVEFSNRVRLTGTLHVAVLPAREKEKIFLSYAKKNNCKMLIETGTFRGETVNACKDFFETIYSIELSEKYFLESKKRFEGISKIHILKGNSSDILPTIINKNISTLFWLDAHYSGGETARGHEDSPIVEEVKTILDTGCNGCILIDDARCFNGKAGYPKISTLRKLVSEFNIQKKDSLTVSVKHDIIRISRV